MILQRFIAAGVDFVFPRICPGCEDRIDSAVSLPICPACQKLPPLQLPVCRVCGRGNAHLQDGGGCTDCPSGKIYFTSARGAAHYGEVARTLVEKLKYKGRLEYAPFMAAHMAEALDQSAPAHSPSLIVPVPLYPARRRERGYNQSEILARELALRLNLPICADALRRVRPTSTQTRLKRRQRVQNVEGAFQPGDVSQLAGAHVLLVDDVYTTGATLNSCSRTLCAAGAASVTCIAFARAYLP